MTTNEQMKTQVTLPSETTILITRTFDAPRRLVWEAYTRAEHLKHWWGPKGWTLPVCEVDFRPGGTWFYCMQGPGPDGGDMLSCGKAFYDEIDEPVRFTYKDSFVDNDGNVLNDFPSADITVEFNEQAGRTTVTSTTTYATKADRDQVLEMGMEAGIDQTLDRLEDYLKTMVQ